MSVERVVWVERVKVCVERVVELWVEVWVERVVELWVEVWVERVLRWEVSV